MAVDYPTIVDRNVATPSRVELAATSGATGSGVYDVTPVTGTVTEEGTPINNSLFQAIKEYIDQGDEGSSFNSPDPVITSGNGSNYTAIIPEWSSITSYNEIIGIPFTLISHVASATTAPTLNINGIGTYGLRSPSAGATGNIGFATTAWWTAGHAITVIFTGDYFRVTSITGIPFGGANVTNAWSGAAIQNTYMLQGRTAVSNNADLNNFTNVGNYVITSPGIMASLSNKPQGVYYEAMLTIGLSSSVAAYVAQELRDSRGGCWTRWTTDGGTTWSDWINNSASVTALIGSNYSTPTEQLNLNNLTGIGSYYCSTGLINAPAASSGVLRISAVQHTVVPDSPVSQLIQEYTTQSTKDVYKRWSGNGGTSWSGWVKEGTSQEITDLQNAITEINSRIDETNNRIDSLEEDISGRFINIERRLSALEGEGLTGTTMAIDTTESGINSFSFALDADGSYSIDWGDGSTESSTGGTITHDYANQGVYTITLTCNNTTSFSVYPAGSTTAANLVSVNLDENITSLVASCFRRTNITVFDMPSSLTSLSASCFRDCRRLERVTLQSGMQNISPGCFARCTTLYDITIPDTVFRLNADDANGGCFEGCNGLTDIILPDSITDFSSGSNDGAGVFAECRNLKSITLSKNITSITANTFYQCKSLETIDIPDSVTSIGIDAFRSCDKLVSVTGMSNVAAIREGAFRGCKSLSEFTIPYGVTIMGGSSNASNGVFSQCASLASVVVENIDNFQTFGTNCFYGCASLTNITIPKGVSVIRYRTFYNCTKLDTLTMLSETPPTLDTTAFTKVPFRDGIYVPNGSLQNYLDAAVWTNYSDYMKETPVV